MKFLHSIPHIRRPGKGHPRPEIFFRNAVGRRREKIAKKLNFFKAGGDAGRVRIVNEQPGHLYVENLAILWEGESRAWREFVTEYAGVIHAAVNFTLSRRGRGEQDLVADLCQDVFVKLVRDDYRLLRRFDPRRASLKTYLAVIARSVALDALKRRRLLTDGLREELVGGAEEERAGGSELLDELPPGMLSARQAQVMRLLFQEELSVSEAAEVLGIEAQTVRSLKHKALEKMRKHYGERRQR